MKFVQIRKNILHAGVAVALVAGMATTLPSAVAGGKITIDDTKWISIGMGIRGGFTAAQNASADGQDYSSGFGINNARIYINGQIHENIKFTFNTECFACSKTNDGGGGQGLGGFGDNSGIGILDIIAKFEFNQYVNLWAGRTLANTERGELNGPYYHPTFDGFKTPFFPQDYSGNFGNSSIGNNAGGGMYGRDDGVVFFGELGVPQPFGMGEGQLQYSAGVFNGTRSSSGKGPNASNAASWTGRLTYNFLNPERNPGYYTSGTYYGGAGDILAIAVGVNHQKDGAGSSANRADFTGLVVDGLFEKVLDNNMGVLTFNGEYKRFWAEYADAANTDGNCMCVFRGQSWTLYGLYLIPHKVGIGRFQPYGRFTSVQPDNSSDREEIEGGVNYVIDGHNARISAYYQHGDLYTKGLNYASGASGDKIDKFVVAFQLQI
ncbi:hypothetical protein OAO51_02245 [Nitrosomonadaceae bacterium]|jgi:hypothetical protein|nr:hypothetical protein [Nitrosomonadaceae bacterium]